MPDADYEIPGFGPEGAPVRWITINFAVNIEWQSVPLAAAGVDYDSQLRSFGGKPVCESE